jgi:hypothetical protein
MFRTAASPPLSQEELADIVDEHVINGLVTRSTEPMTTQEPRFGFSENGARRTDIGKRRMRGKGEYPASRLQLRLHARPDCRVRGRHLRWLDSAVISFILRVRFSGPETSPMRAIFGFVCFFSLSAIAPLDDDQSKRAVRTAEARAVLAEIAVEQPSQAGTDLPEGLRQAIEAWTIERSA